MHLIKSQVIAGTRLDLQGERLPVGVLHKFCEAYQGRAMPIHKLHSMQHEPLGYIENLHVVRDAEDEWSLVGDVTLHSGTIDEALRGFSISYMEPISVGKTSLLSLYLPYPFYNDHDLLDLLEPDQELLIGKWVKKVDAPTTVALLIAGFSVLLTPLWEQIYSSKVAPVIQRFLDSHSEELQERKIDVEFIQVIELGGRAIELRFLPWPSMSNVCLAPEAIVNGIKVAQRYLEELGGGGEVSRLVLEYDLSNRTFHVTRHEFLLS